MSSFITAEILRKIIPTLSLTRASEMAPLFNEVCPAYGLNAPDVFHEFIATLGEESGGLEFRTENMNYGTVGLLKTFPKYFKTTAEALAYNRQPERIANRVYANRMGNGNEASGDGWRYRGSGFIQSTGKDMHSAYAKKLGVSIEKAGELMRTTDRYALDSACWIFSVVKGLNDEARDDKFIEITKRINGGLTNLESRVAYLNRARKYLPG